ncbi:MAG: hypothetical protein WC615_02575 [Mucilaginibacter sp.]|jgi:hypothetical protein|uniref:hypothetical protein n=1 Tax=Mucilaginibacter sp. TaxID=1882438 RepID=UPI003567D586
MKNLTSLVFILLLATFFSACKLDPVDYNHDVKPGGAVPGGTDNGGSVGSAEYYFKGKLNGTDLAWPVNDSGDWGSGISQPSEYGPDNLIAGYGGGIVNSKVFMVNYPAVMFYFKTLHATTFDQARLLLKSFITTGTWAYAPNVSLIADVKDVYVAYTDKNNVIYNTVGDQTGSTFTVVSTMVIPAEPGIAERIKVKLNVNCKLYPVDGNGASLTLTNCEAVIYLQAT